MESENQTPAEPGEASANPNTAEISGSSATNEAATTSSGPSSSSEQNATELGPSTSSDGNTGPAVESPLEKPTAKRNYRRRLENSDEESSDDAATGVQPESTPVEENQQSSESEDVSLEELRVSRSDNGNNQNSGR